jgi:hypothetical protein
MRILFGVFTLITFFSTPLVHAQDTAATAGWEKASPYNSRYNAAELDQLRGVVSDIREVVPLPALPHARQSNHNTGRPPRQTPVRPGSAAPAERLPASGSG